MVMLALLIMAPTGCEFRDLINAVEQVVHQPVVTHGPVAALDVSVLMQLARVKELVMAPNFR